MAFELKNHYFIQHSDGTFLRGYRKVYTTPTGQWMSTWSKTPEVGRSLADAMYEFEQLITYHNINPSDLRILALTTISNEGRTSND